MKNKICKCGHESGQHTDFTFTGVGECQMPDCTCKKFESVDSAKELNKLLKKDLEQLEKPKNHSQPDVEKPGGDGRPNNPSGSDNSPQKKSVVAGVQRLEDTLSSKIWNKYEGFEGTVYVTEIKEFIKKDTQVIKDFRRGKVSFEVMMRVREKLWGKELLE